MTFTPRAAEELPPAPTVPAPHVRAPFNKLAHWSITGAILFGPVGVVLGIVALVQMAKTRERGKPAAIFSIIWGGLSSLFSIALALLLVVGGLASIAGHKAVHTGDTSQLQQDGPTKNLPFSGDGVSPDGLHWADGDSLTAASSRPQWADTLIGNPDWRQSEPANGTGSWEYTSTSTGCTIRFTQALWNDADPADSDRDATKAFLTGFIEDAEPSAAAEFSTPEDHALSFKNGDESPAGARVDGLLTRTDTGVLWVRAFSKIRVLLMIGGYCPAGVDTAPVLGAIDGQGISQL